MRSFPLFLKLEGRPVLLVGAGSAAAANLRLLGSAGARVIVIADTPSADLLAAVADTRATFVRDVLSLQHFASVELVWDSHPPIGPYPIMDLLRAADDRAAAPPTVYTALEFLLDQGLVHKIESLNAFVGCDRPEERHISQFLICTACKAAVELNDPAITQAVEASAKQSGFSLNRLTVEAQGLCAACRTGREAA
jgi:Fur family zinc uptake transcriptional regulator